MNSEEDFRVLKADVQNGAAKRASTITKKVPNKSPQKAKQENRTNGEVVRVGRIVPTFTKIGSSGKGEILSRGGGNCGESWPTITTTSSSPSGPRSSGRSV